VTPIFVKPRDSPHLLSFDPSKKCEHHFGVERHTLVECVHLRHRIQDVIDNKLMQFNNTTESNVITNPLPLHPKRNVNTISKLKEKIPNFSFPSFPWRARLRALAQESHIALENKGATRFDWENCSFCGNGDRYTLFDCRVLRAQVQSLADYGIIRIERKVVWRSDCMETSLCPPSTQAGTGHSAMSIGLRKD